MRVANFAAVPDPNRADGRAVFVFEPFADELPFADTDTVGAAEVEVVGPEAIEKLAPVLFAAVLGSLGTQGSA
jgi:hypothetical protein